MLDDHDVLLRLFEYKVLRVHVLRLFEYNFVFMFYVYLNITSR